MAEVPDADSNRKRRHTPGGDVLEQTPPAKPLTLVLFYLLVAGTLGMAAWAMISIIS